MVLRKRFWIDREVQGVLVGRIIIYWAIVVLYFGLGSACFQYYHDPQASYQEHFQALFSLYWPWLPSLILLLPLVVYDVIRLSNLFVGPIYRLRTQLHEIADNPECRPMGFRTDDYWLDLVHPMNRLHADVLRMRSQIHELKQSLAAQAIAMSLDVPADSHDSQQDSQQEAQQEALVKQAVS